jgi:internalin A
MQKLRDIVPQEIRSYMFGRRFYRDMRHRMAQSARPHPPDEDDDSPRGPFTDRKIAAMAREVAGLNGTMSGFGGPIDSVDLSVFSKFTALRSLDLYDESLTIDDVSPLSVLKALQHLDFGICLAIPNLQTLSALSALTSVAFRASRAIPDLSPLANLARLEMRGSFRDVTELSTLSTLTNLQHLEMWVEDKHQLSVTLSLEPLARLVKLREIRGTAIWGFNNISPLTHLTDLQRLELESIDNVTDISPLSSLTNLEAMRLSSDQLKDISPLSSLTKLNHLHLKGSKLIDDLSPLKHLKGLKRLWLYEAGISAKSLEELLPLTNLTNLCFVKCPGLQGSMDIFDDRFDQLLPIIML